MGTRLAHNVLERRKGVGQHVGGGAGGATGLLCAGPAGDMCRWEHPNHHKSGWGVLWHSQHHRRRAVICDCIHTDVPGSLAPRLKSATHRHKYPVKSHANPEGIGSQPSEEWGRRATRAAPARVPSTTSTSPCIACIALELQEPACCLSEQATWHDKGLFGPRAVPK